MCECFHPTRARKISLKNVASTPTFSLSIGKFCGQVSRKPLARFRLLTARRMATNVRRCPAFILWQTGNYPSFRGEKGEKRCLKVDRAQALSRLSITSRSYYAKMLDPDYYKVLLEIGVGRRFWQSNPSAENAHAFYVRVIRPLRRLQRRGVVEKLQEITPTDDRTPIAVEIIGQVNLTK